MTSHVVDITRVIKNAVRVRVSEIVPGDSVFDVYGGAHLIKNVRTRGSRVYLTRTDGWRDAFDAAEIITILRASK